MPNIFFVSLGKNGLKRTVFLISTHVYLCTKLISNCSTLVLPLALKLPMTPQFRVIESSFF